MNIYIVIVSLIALFAIIAMELVVNKKIVKAKSDKKTPIAVSNAKSLIALSDNTKKFFSLFPRLKSKGNILATKEGANLHDLNAIVRIFDAVDAKSSCDSLIEDYNNTENAILYSYDSLSKLALISNIGLELDLINEDIVRGYELQEVKNNIDPKTLAVSTIDTAEKEIKNLEVELKQTKNTLLMKAIKTQIEDDKEIIKSCNKIINSTNTDSAIKRVDISTQLRRVSNHILFSALKRVAASNANINVVDLCDEILKNIVNIDRKTPPTISESANLRITRENKDILQQVFPEVDNK